MSLPWRKRNDTIPLRRIRTRDLSRVVPVRIPRFFLIYPRYNVIISLHTMRTSNIHVILFDSFSLLYIIGNEEIFSIPFLILWTTNSAKLIRLKASYTEMMVSYPCLYIYFPITQGGAYVTVDFSIIKDYFLFSFKKPKCWKRKQVLFFSKCRFGNW